MTTRSPLHGFEPASQGGALALVVRLQQQREPELLLEALQRLARAVGRGIVDDDELRPDGDGQDTPHDFIDGVLLVECRHDDRQKRIVQRTSNSATLPRRHPIAKRMCRVPSPRVADDGVERRRGCGTHPSSLRDARRRRVEHRRIAGAPRRHTERHRLPADPLDRGQHVAHRRRLLCAHVIGGRLAAALPADPAHARARRRDR